jgi:hypothetical protein
MGLEPTPGPWQGPVLPLYYDRPVTSKLYHDTLAAARSHRHREIRARSTGGITPVARLYRHLTKRCRV